MDRYGWLMVIGVVLLGALAWVGVDTTLADDDTRLGPPVVIPSPTVSEAPQEPTEEPTLDTSQSPTAPASGEQTSDDADSHGADRIRPAPPRTAGDDEDDDDDDSDDHDDDDDRYDDDEHDDDD